MGFVKHYLYDWCVENDRRDLLESWLSDRNGQLTPHNTAFASNKFVWWHCPKCGYEWQSKVSNRSIGRRGCPLCAGKVVVAGVNDLCTTHSELVKEWHPTLNGDLTPNQISYGYGRKVWWQCPYGHEYQATPNHRTSKDNPTSCPKCYSGRQTSFAEQALFYYVQKLFPDAVNRYRANFLGTMELDVFIPSIKYAIEYDGIAWHKKEKISREQLKYRLCHQAGIRLIRLREEAVPMGSDIADYIWHAEDLYEPMVLEPILREVLRRLVFFKSGFLRYVVDVNIERDRQRILQYNTSIRENSFKDKYPKLALEWHPTKNGALKPNAFTSGSDHKVWWKCPVCLNDYKSSIAHRVAGTGCPKCALERVTSTKRKPVVQIDPTTGDVVGVHLSIADAAKKLQINGSNITSVCKGKRPIAGGYFWRYK